jgi:hypothetical protein
MGFVIKHDDGRYVSGFDGDEAQFTEDFSQAWWWESEEDADWYINANELDDVQPADSGGSNPPGPGQPGKP